MIWMLLLLLSSSANVGSRAVVCECVYVWCGHDYDYIGAHMNHSNQFWRVWAMPYVWCSHISPFNDHISTIAPMNNKYWRIKIEYRPNGARRIEAVGLLGIYIFDYYYRRCSGTAASCAVADLHKYKAQKKRTQWKSTHQLKRFISGQPNEKEKKRNTQTLG